MADCTQFLSEDRLTDVKFLDCLLFILELNPNRLSVFRAHYSAVSALVLVMLRLHCVTVELLVVVVFSRDSLSALSSVC